MGLDIGSLDEAELRRDIKHLLDKLDKKKGVGRLAKPDRRTVFSSADIAIDLTPLVVSSSEPPRPEYAVTRAELIAELKHS